VNFSTGLMITDSTAKAIRRPDKLMDIARLERRMAGIRHDAQVGLRPCAMQIPRAA
jgi:hypothetical protein